MKMKPKLCELNEQLLCKLCSGYMIDATSMTECPHSFCRSCILNFLQSTPKCPNCEKEVNLSKLDRYLRPDNTLQDLIYKLVPGLYQFELQRRKDFYTQLCQKSTSTEEGAATAEAATGATADGLPGRRIQQKIFDKHLVELATFICPQDELISLSVEYAAPTPINTTDKKDDEPKTEKTDEIKDKKKNDKSNENGKKHKEKDKSKDNRVETLSFKRYFRCPAAVTIGHLKKLLEYKLELPHNYQIDMIHSDEILDPDFTLMDVAYIYSWRRKSPMQLFFNIVQLECDDQMPCLTRETSPPVLSIAQSHTPASPKALQIDESASTEKSAATSSHAVSTGAVDKKVSTNNDPSITVSSTANTNVSSLCTGSTLVFNVITSSTNTTTTTTTTTVAPARKKQKRKQMSPSKKTRKPPPETSVASINAPFIPPPAKVPKLEESTGSFLSNNGAVLTEEQKINDLMSTEMKIEEKMTTISSGSNTAIVVEQSSTTNTNTGVVSAVTCNSQPVVTNAYPVNSQLDNRLLAGKMPIMPLAPKPSLAPQSFPNLVPTNGTLRPSQTTGLGTLGVVILDNKPVPALFHNSGPSISTR